MRRVLILHGLFPPGKIDSAGKGREHDELCENDFRLLRPRSRGVEGIGTIAGEAQDEGPDDANVVAAEFAQSLHQALAGKIEILVYLLQSLGRNRFNAYQCALMCAAFIAVKNSTSSAASMVSACRRPSFEAERAAPSVLTAPRGSLAVQPERAALFWRLANSRSVSVTG